MAPDPDVPALTEGLGHWDQASVLAQIATPQAQSAHAERMKALGQLAGGIAHDFNNVLQVVSGAAGRINKHPGDSEGVARQARRIEEAVERGSAISRRLLAFARRDSQSSDPIDAATLLADLGDLLAHTIGPCIRIGVDVAEAQGRFVADRRQLETVILNLATNARDAMPSGGDLILTAASVDLEHDLEFPFLKAGQYVRIAVADTGVGMSAAILARVTEPFFTTKPKGLGTGLGLSMAKGFAEQSGGAFAITSEPGRGTTVTLWLPHADPTSGRGPEAAAGEAGGAPAIGAGRRVLVVDDDEPVRATLTSSLEDAGFATLRADCAKCALALLDHGAVVDAVITDFSMPGVHGIDLIRAIHVRAPGLPAVLLTGHVCDVAASKAGNQSDDFSLLQKPVRPAHIAEHLAMLMAKGSV